MAVQISQLFYRQGRRAYLVGSHREGVNISLFRGAAIGSIELRGFHLLGSHITNKVSSGGYATGCFDSGVGDNSCNGKVRQTRDPILSDQDIPLGGLSVRGFPSKTLFSPE